MFRNRFYLFLLSRLQNGRDWIRRCLHRCKCVLCRDLYFFPLLIQNDNLVGYYMISLMMITAYVCRYLPCVYCCYIRHSFCFPRLFHLQRLKHKSRPCSHCYAAWSGYMSLFTSFPLNCVAFWSSPRTLVFSYILWINKYTYPSSRSLRSTCAHPRAERFRNT